MRNRQSTKAEDLEKLYETLERARSPTGLLTVKIGEMESGRFIGKVKPDKDWSSMLRAQIQPEMARNPGETAQRTASAWPGSSNWTTTWPQGSPS